MNEAAQLLGAQAVTHDDSVAKVSVVGLGMARQTGVDFTNRLDEWSSAANRVLENGSGAAVGDFDGDGRPDIFAANWGRNTKFQRYLCH